MKRRINEELQYKIRIQLIQQFSSSLRDTTYSPILFNYLENRKTYGKIIYTKHTICISLFSTAFVPNIFRSDVQSDSKLVTGFSVAYNFQTGKNKIKLGHVEVV
jgi:hypothetical protein